MSLINKISTTLNATFATVALSMSAQTTAAAPAEQPACYTDNKAFIAVDYQTGQRLSGQAEDMIIQPGSLAKIMSLYIMHKAIEEGKISWNDRLIISNESREEGAENGGVTSKSKKYPTYIERTNVRHGIAMIAMRSYNDITIALAKDVAVAYGSNAPNNELESVFVDMMNEATAEFGMTDTHYDNSTGLPSKKSHTTVRDNSLLLAGIKEKQPDLYRALGKKAGQYGNRWLEHSNTLEHDKPFGGRRSEYDVIGKTAYVSDICRSLAVIVKDRNSDEGVVFVSTGHTKTHTRHVEAAHRIQNALKLRQQVVTENKVVAGSVTLEDSNAPAFQSDILTLEGM